MRKSFDALSGLVRNELQRDPVNGEVYEFVNRSRTCIKLLHWESGSGLDLRNLTFKVHSANPIAAEQIKGLLNNYIRHLNTSN